MTDFPHTYTFVVDFRHFIWKFINLISLSAEMSQTPQYVSSVPFLTSVGCLTLFDLEQPNLA